MSDQAVAIPPIVAATLPIVTNLVQRSLGALVESGVDNVKIGWMQHAAAQILIDPHLDGILMNTSKLGQLRASPIVSALLAPAPKLVLDGLLEEPSGRTLVALITIWALLLDDAYEIANRIHRYARAFMRSTNFPPPSEREVWACCLPALAHNIHRGVDDLYDCLVGLERRFCHQFRLAPRLGEAELAGEIAAAIARGSREPESWIELVNCEGVSDTIVAMAYVTGFAVEVTCNGRSVEVEDHRFRAEESGAAHPARIRVTYYMMGDTLLGKTQVNICSKTDSIALFTHSRYSDGYGLARDASHIRLSIMEKNSIAVLRTATQAEVKEAVGQCFTTAFSCTLETHPPWENRRNAWHLLTNTLNRIDALVPAIDAKPISVYVASSEFRDSLRPFSESLQRDESGADPGDYSPTASTFKAVVIASMIRSMFGDNCGFFFVKPDRFFRFTSFDVENDYAKVLRMISAYGEQFASSSGYSAYGGRFAPSYMENFQVMASVVRIGPYTAAPRCLVEPGLPDETASPLMIVTAVISLEGGSCGWIGHDPPMDYVASHIPEEENLMTMDGVDHTPSGDSWIEIVRRKNQHYYRSFEAGVQMDMSALLKAGFSALRVPQSFHQQSLSKTWTAARPGNDVSDTRFFHVYNTFENSAGRRLAASQAAANFLRTVFRGTENLETTLAFAEVIEARVVIT